MEADLTNKIISTRLKLEEINKLSAQLEEHRAELMTFLQTNCFNNCVNFESKEDYYPGNYNDTAFTQYQGNVDTIDTVTTRTRRGKNADPNTEYDTS